MNVHNVRNELAEVLKATSLSQVDFAAKHGLSYSWINKFLNAKQPNPRVNSLLELQAAIDAERGTRKRGRAA
jgi:transcriptional regulator with XRE-family HTH domain